MSTRPILMALTLSISLLPQIPANAAHGPGCPNAAHGPTWKTEDQCDFSLQGLPISVFGDASASSGAVNVRVWVTAETAMGPITLVECSASGTKYARCTEEFGPARIDPYVQSAPLVCHVKGKPGGLFACQSLAGGA